MANLLNTEVVRAGSLDLVDVAIITAAKLGSDYAGNFIPYVRKGTLLGGGLKLATAALVGASFKEQYVRDVAVGMAISGAEDLLIGVMSRAWMKNGNAKSDAVMVV